MRTLIEIPAEPIRSALQESGWQIAAVEEPSVWWCRERWHLRSAWSPQNREAYLTFLVDPQDDSNKPKVMGVKASASPPIQWQSSEQEHMLYFGRGWREQLGRLVEYLDGVRNRGPV